MTTTTESPLTLDSVKGWFPQLDQRLFTWVLERQDQLRTEGDLLELGAYLGKSAILIGRYLREAETFTVCDLFDTPAGDAANDAEMQRSYSSLTRTAFENNYLAFHRELPVVVEALTSVIKEHVQPDTCRFVHVDASHLYEHVQGDIDAARLVLNSSGVVVCDDYRSEHTPGVAAAVWEAVAMGGLRPICLTTQKFYGTWGDPGPIQDELLSWLAGEPGYFNEVQQIAGHRVVRVRPEKKAKVSTTRRDEELKQLRATHRREIDVLNENLKDKQEQIKAIRGSVSYRLGRAITAGPRKLRSR